MSKGIEVVIGAKDQASAILQQVAAQTRRVGSGVKQAATDTQSSTSSMSRSFSNLAGAVKGLVAGFLAYKATQASLRFLSSSAAAADVQAEAERSLAKAIELAGDATGPTIQQHKEWASQLQQVANVGDEVTLGLMKQASMLGVSNENLQDVTRAAIGLSEATGQDMNTSLRAVQLALAGNFTQLGRYVPAIREAATEEEKLAIVQDLASKGLIQKAERAKTAQGAGERLANSWGDFKEVIGKALEPVRLLVSTGLAVLVETIQTSVIPAIASITPSAETLGNVMQAMRDAVIRAITFIEVIVGNFGTVWEIAKKSAELQLLGIAETISYYLTQVIPAYANWFGQNWFNIIRDSFAAAYTVIRNWIDNASNAFLAFFEWMRSGFEGGTTGLWKRIGESWSKDLLDGFQATTTSLPEIAARQITASEQALMSEISGLTNDIAAQYQSTLADRLGAAGSVAGQSLLENLDLAATQASQMGEGVKAQMNTLQATQGRLLTRGSGNNPLLDEAKRQTKAQERTAQAVEQLVETGGTQKREVDLVMIGP